MWDLIRTACYKLISTVQLKSLLLQHASVAIFTNLNKAESMEDQLLENGENSRWIITREWETYYQELKKLTYIAAPMVAVSVLQYLLQVVSMMMAGHLDQISLSSVAIATSITNVSGFSLLVSPLSL